MYRGDIAMSKNKDKKKPKNNTKNQENKDYKFNPLGVYAGLIKSEFTEPEQNGEDF